MTPSQRLQPRGKAGNDSATYHQRFRSLQGNAKQFGMGGEVPTIQAEGNLAFVDISAKLMELVKNCWTAATTSQDAPRGAIQVGAGARQAHIPAW